jgi:mRNA interferase HigB
MLIVNSRILEDFILKYPQSGKPLDRWIRITKNAKWKNLADIKNHFNSVDYVNGIYIFNIKGNSYRLIVDIFFHNQSVFVLAALTHSEYNRIEFGKTNILKFRRKTDSGNS